MATTIKKALTFALLTGTLVLSTGFQGASTYSDKVADPPGRASLDEKHGGPGKEKKEHKEKKQKKEKNDQIRITKPKATEERSVPAPPPFLLIGVAAAVVWLLRIVWPIRRVD